MLGNKKPPCIQCIFPTKETKGVTYKEVPASCSHAVILTDKTDKHCVDLFPFLIDYNSLKVKTEISEFLLFWSCNVNDDTTSNLIFKKINYKNDKGLLETFSYDDSIKTYQDTRIINHSKQESIDSRTMSYNINRLMDSLGNKNN